MVVALVMEKAYDSNSDLDHLVNKSKRKEQLNNSVPHSQWVATITTKLNLR